MNLNRGLVGASADARQLLDASTEELLLLGADSRAHLVDGGLNRYGCRPAPRTAIAFGSCTASSPNPQVYGAAVACHAALRQAAQCGDWCQEVERGYRQVVSGLTRHLHLDRVAGVRIALTPSGTDAEFLAMLLALGDRRRPLCNIVVGPKEVGSGTQGAAGGQHFDAFTPHGPRALVGSPVSAPLAERVEVRTVRLRDEGNIVREPADLDSETAAAVAEAIARGQRVLLHVVAHSKTGVHAPSLATVRQLRRQYPGDVVVVVDAAQGRFSRRGLVESLREGSLVLFTASKFYGGPPFAGAVLVPECFNPLALGTPPIPEEYSSYFSVWELPREWSAFAAGLTHTHNLGLLLRWTAGHEAVRAYYAVPGEARFAVLRRFEDLVPGELAKSAWLELDSVEPVHFPAGAERLLESKTTVFPFRIRVTPHEPRAYLNKAELKRIAKWLNHDISELVPQSSAASQRVLAARYHVGQPVFEGDAGHPAVLRIALGSALITQVGADPACGQSLEQRLDWLEQQVKGVLAKLEWIASHYAALAAAEHREAQ